MRRYVRRYVARTGSAGSVLTLARRAGALAALVVFLSACVTVGRDFPAEKVYDLRIGTTTQAEVRALFGEPWRVGIDDGNPTWTYAIYHYNAFSRTRTRDLVVRFDAHDIVRSYTFNTSDPADIRKAAKAGQ